MSARRHPRRLVALLVATGAVAAVLAAVPAGAATPPRAPGDPVGGLTVSIAALSPVSPRPGDTLTLSGVVSNANEEAVQAVAVRLRLSSGPLGSRADIPSVLAAAQEPAEDGADYSVSGTRTDVVDRLRPGQSAPFTIAVPIEDVGLFGRGVYVVGVEALGATSDGAATALGVARTFLPWIPDPAAVAPTGVVTLWPLSEAPAVDSEGLLLTTALPAAVSPGGRLRTLLDAGTAAPGVVSWMVDPSTLETVSAMSRGYRVLTPTGVEVGTAGADAGAWLAATRTALAAADVTALPYADPDEVALVRGGLQRDVVRATTTAAAGAGQTLGRIVGSTLAWPANGLVDQATLAVLGDTGASGVLISDTQLRPDPPTDFTPTGSAPLPSLSGSRKAVVADAALGASLLMPQTTAAAVVMARQRFLAELAMITLELPATSRTVVAAPPVRWSPTPAFARAVVTTLPTLGWARPVGLGTLLAAEPSVVTRTLGPYPDAARRAELPAEFVERLARTEQAAATLGEITGETTDSSEALVAALQRSGSSAWRRQERTGAQLLARTSATVAESTSKVAIVSRGSVSLPGETGIIPVTVANDLDVPVTVGLTVTGEPAVRLSTEPVAPITIAPQRKASIEVRARVAGSGPVTAVLQLTTASGAPYGEERRLEVGSAAYARAAAWVVGAAFALLLVLVGVNAVRRVRVARAARAARAGSDGTMPS